MAMPVRCRIRQGDPSADHWRSLRRFLFAGCWIAHLCIRNAGDACKAATPVPEHLRCAGRFLLGRDALRTRSGAGCFKSTQLPRRTVDNLSNFVDVSCSSAATENLAQPQSLLLANPDRPVRPLPSGIVTLTIGSGDVRILVDHRQRAPPPPGSHALQDQFVGMAGTRSVSSSPRHRRSSKASPACAQSQGLHPALSASSRRDLCRRSEGCFSFAPSIAVLARGRNQHDDRAQAALRSTFFDTYWPASGTLPGPNGALGRTDDHPGWAQLHPNQTGMTETRARCSPSCDCRWGLTATSSLDSATSFRVRGRVR
jgi:hypothetical protein